MGNPLSCLSDFGVGLELAFGLSRAVPQLDGASPQLVSVCTGAE